MSLRLETEAIFTLPMGQDGVKKSFFCKGLESLLLSFLTISDGSGVQICCLKMILKLHKIRFLTFPKIESLDSDPSALVLKGSERILKCEQTIC